MNSIKYIFINILETLVRFLPIPTKTRLIKIGAPGRDSPVILTCNFGLTVERVKKALEGMDAYLLVANSRGINVWCAATGGLFTDHDAVSALKTSGIEECVDHRTVILPQLAATGMETRVIRKKTGWKAVWGPVRAEDIPAFIKSEFVKTPQMREVTFTLLHRFEMALMWAFPFSTIVGLPMFFFWRDALLPTYIIIWALALLIFLPFPLYSRWLQSKKGGAGFSKYTIIFDFGRFPLIVWGIFLIGLFVYSILTGAFAWGFIGRWSLISFIVVLVLNLDLKGSTPVYKSDLHEDSLFKVVLDKDKCKGAAACEAVCPRNCYDVDKEGHTATMARPDRCVHCGACIVQCPFDALYFRNPDGEILSPETIRKFKLNLMGKRLVNVDSALPSSTTDS